MAPLLPVADLWLEPDSLENRPTGSCRHVATDPVIHPDGVGLQNIVESLQVFFGAGGVIQRVPQMYNRDGKASFQTKDPFIHNANHQVRVLISPSPDSLQFWKF